MQVRVCMYVCRYVCVGICVCVGVTQITRRNLHMFEDVLTMLNYVKNQ